MNAGAGVVATVRLVLHAGARLSLDGDVGTEPLRLLLLLWQLVRLLPPGGVVRDDGVDVFQLQVWELAVRLHSFDVVELRVRVLVVGRSGGREGDKGRWSGGPRHPLEGST